MKTLPKPNLFSDLKLSNLTLRLSSKSPIWLIPLPNLKTTVTFLSTANGCPNTITTTKLIINANLHQALDIIPFCPHYTIRDYFYPNCISKEIEAGESTLSAQRYLKKLHYLPSQLMRGWAGVWIWVILTPRASQWLHGKECRRPKRHRLDPWVWKIPWRR